VVERGHLREVGGAAVVDEPDAAEVGARLARRGAHLLFASQDGDARQPVARARRGGRQRARVFALGQDDVLRVGGGHLPDAFE
jgi:hypothetical protein